LIIVNAADEAINNADSHRCAEHMNETAGADAERRGGAAAPSQLQAAADDIGGVRSGRDVEQHA
jgi:hypothetical protein